MPRISPTLEGFRAAFRRPSLTLAEISWRWTVGALAFALFLFGFIEYLATLPVNDLEATLLRTKQALLVMKVITHLLRGSMSRAVLAALFATLALCLLWITAASLGRAATLRALLDHFREKVAANASFEMPNPAQFFGCLIGLNFLRAAAALAATLAFLGAAILASFASPKANPQPGLAVIICIPLAAFISIVWAALNWLLSLACIFALRDGADALGALSAAVGFLRERAGPVFAVSTWTGIAHLAAFVGASIAVSLPLPFVHVAPARLIVAAVALITLAYFAVVDWLYIARLAGYVCIAVMPEPLASPALLPLTPPVSPQHLAPSIPTQTAVDRDELILGDVPTLAVET